jgi:hypothetical protein
MARTGNVLVVMAKYPTPGVVKTRLAERVGADAACALYRAFLADIAARCAAGPWSVVWAVTPGGANLAPFVGTADRQVAQQGGDLAERMRHCFAQLLGAGVQRVVMIGADAPHIAEATLRAAFAALDEDDTVFVPTRDGGYCLVGMRAAHDIFSGIPMGTRAVFEATRARLAALDLQCRVLDTSFDVDDLRDVIELARLIGDGGVRLPHTAAVLRDWRAARLLP